MSSPISLIEIPEVAMKHICEYLDFPSILILRKVCHDLRNFIDDTKPASRLKKIYVDVMPETISFNLYLPRASSWLRIDYQKHGERCLVKCYEEENVKETIVKDAHFVTLFRKDFQIVLRHQMTVLENFRITFDSFNSTVWENILDQASNTFKSLNHPLQVKSLYMTVSNHDEIMSILPYIDPKLLELIHIYEPSRKFDVLLNLDEIAQLAQWKQAKELKIQGFQLSYLYQNFKHFSSIDLGYREISIEQLILLQEICLSSSTLNKISIEYNFNFIENTKLKLIEVFGQPFHDNNDQDDYWVFRIPDTDQFLRIKMNMYSIDFNRIEQSRVPQNAIISN